MTAIPYQKLILRLFISDGTPTRIIQQMRKLDSVLRDHHFSEIHRSLKFISLSQTKYACQAATASNYSTLFAIAVCMVTQANGTAGSAQTY
jgi:hypothetical protein